MKKLLLILLLAPLLLAGQNTIGLPDVINYPKKTYGAGLQTWDIGQDANGIIYMANNEGLLSFDGQYWKIFPLPNRTIVRSVNVASPEMIFAGGQDEIGYFSPDAHHKLSYHSLTSLIPANERSFGDVWDICSYQKATWFRTLNRIYRYADNSITVFHAPQEWTYMGVCGDKLLAHDGQAGIMQFMGNAWQPLEAARTLPSGVVTSITPLGPDSSLVTTLKNGVYVLGSTGMHSLNNPMIDLLKNYRIYAATPISKDWIAMATNLNGVVIIDTKGNLIQQFSKGEGLQNNNVLSIFLDRQKNLWLGLDNGIDFIAYNSAIKRISPYTQDGSGYAALIYKNKLYAGTSAGLFSVPLQVQADLSFSKGIFQPVGNTTGQVWGLAAVNDKLLLGHHEGGFVVENDVARPFYTTGKGVWNFVPVSNVFPSPQMITGTYHGLSFFDYKNGAFIASGQVNGLDESSRFVSIDKDGIIWVSHPYHGVYKVFKDGSGIYQYKLYTASNGLPSSLNNHVYKINNEVLVATEKGVYSYDAAKDRFIPSPFYQELLGQQSIRYLSQDTEGNIWFIHEKKLAVLDRSQSKPRIIRIPELDNKLLSGFEFIYPVNASNIFIGGEKGFFLVNYAKYKQNLPALSVMIREVRISKRTDSLLYGGYTSNTEKRTDEIRNDWGNIHISYSSPVFGQQDNLEFSYRLKGFDDNWSEWNAKTEKEYTHLPAGNFYFEVKVRNNLGNESAVAVYHFRILPPWYQSIWAYLLYLILIVVGIYYLYKWQIKKFRLQQEKYEKEQKQLQYLHQLEINKAENELVALRNEKLQAEVDFKNSELATNAMHLVQKGELLAKLKAELNHLMKAVDNDKAHAEIKKIIKVLGEDDKMETDWQHFTHHFDKVHSDFVVVLKEKFPSITPNELKLSAYLRMNLSTKEIARLMNISVRGVEISRYRLRKKLAIPTDVNLFDFLMNIKGASGN